MKKLASIVLGATMLSVSATSAFAYTDITPQEAMQAIKDDSAIVLDVRTASEYIWVGHPKLGDQVENISYKVRVQNDFIKNPLFMEDVRKRFENKHTKLILMCRSGKRSVAASKELDEAGYTRVYNMVTGFEGGKRDANGYRSIEGWKNSKLPGTQSKIGKKDYYQK